MSCIVLPELPHTWTAVRIGDIARVVYGDALTAEMRNSEGSVNVYGSGGIVGKHDVSLHLGPSIIIGRKGSVGSIYLEAQPFWCIDTAFYLDRISDQVDIEFLFYLLAFLDLRRLAIVVGVPGLNRSDLESTEIPLPTLHEQQRIVAILRQAEELRRLRREEIEQAQELPTTLFLEMFGDPINNPKNYKKVALGKLGQLDRGISKHRPRDAAFLYGGNYPFVQTGDVTNSDGWITSYSQTYSEEGLAQSRLWPKGTLCITIAANIARTGILTFDACFPDSVVGFLPGLEVTTEYVMFAITLFQHHLEAQAPQAAQKNINLQVLRTLQIPKPGIDLQKDFSKHVNQIRQQFFRTREAEESLDRLFAVVQTDSFLGNSTAIWRTSHRRDLEIAARARDAALGQTNGKVIITEYTPTARQELPQPERYWLTNHLGAVQGFVWEALREWPGTLIPSEDLDEFRQSAEQMEQVEDANDHILRALSQLAGLGLIAQVSVPNQQGEYVVGYRGLREGERVLPADIQSALELQR